MALFSQTPSNGGAKRRPEASSFSIIAQDLQVTGNIETPGVVKVEGQVRGSIRAGDQVLISAGATVEGDLISREAVIGGVVLGGIEAAERVELLATAVVTGNVMTGSLLIHEGGRLNGEISMRGEGEGTRGRGDERMADGSERGRMEPGAVQQALAS